MEERLYTLCCGEGAIEKIVISSLPTMECFCLNCNKSTILLTKKDREIINKAKKKVK